MDQTVDLQPQGGITLATAVYERLRADILQGALPPGAKLRIEVLRERYGAGGTPVREALNRLTSAGLVQQREQRGFIVTPVSIEELDELIKTRCWVEEVALRESIKRARPSWEEGVVLAFHRLSKTPRSASADAYVVNPEWERLHHDFHMALLADCGSRWLTAFCEQLNDQACRYRQFAVASVFPKRTEAVEHKSIMEAALAGRADEAVELLQQHYRLTGAITRDALAQAGEAGDGAAGARARRGRANGGTEDAGAH
ncbi:MAG: GntR family transcriptional regulator [Alphaproteobacteria bacterium]|nr:GntR family transcriptional regulator [Alphaproteobacteria bacterium]